MATSLRLGGTDSTSIINELHTLLMSLKVTHYNTTGYAEHQALGMTYDTLEGLVDDISEKFMGYSNTRIKSLVVGTVNASNAQAISSQLKAVGNTLTALGVTKKYPDLENLGQEVSGLGAKLMYLSTLK